MRKLIFAGVAMAAALFGASNVLDFTLNSIDGKPAPLSQYQGNVVLIVNVASRCGYTPQYDRPRESLREVQGPGIRDPGIPRQ